MTEQEAIKELHIIRPRGIIIPKKRAEAIDVAIKALAEIQEYLAIGSVYEFMVAVEKQMAKKPIIEHENTSDCVTEVEWKCPICGTNYIELTPCGEWCRYCGTKLDWSEET